MLILAAAALAKVTATGLNALGRWLNYLQQSGAGEALLYFRHLGFHEFPGSHPRHEHDEIAEPGNALAAESNVFNRQRERLADGESGRLNWSFQM